MSRLVETSENNFFPISYRQFIKLSNEFAEKTKEFLETDKLFIDVSTYIREGEKAPYSVSEKRVSNIHLISAEEFNKAAMVKVSMFPLPTDPRNPNAMAIATFKDCNPKKSSLEISF